MDKFIPQSPDKFLKQEADMTGARFGHINAIVDDVNNLSAAVNVISNQVDVLEYNYIEVPISKAEILTLGSQGVVLLPSVAPDEYYDIPKLVIEFTNGANGYALSDFLLIGTTVIASALITFNNTYTTITQPMHGWEFDGGSGLVYKPLSLYGAGLGFTTYGNTDPTLIGGTDGGTLLAKIWYRVRTKGTEL